MTAKVSTGYKPRPLQLDLHRNLNRFNVLVAHRRFGKTVFTINETIDQALRCPLERPRYAYIAPLYRQAKAIAWDYLMEYTRPIPGTVFNQAELRADLPNGARITLYGADNPDSLRGIYLDGVVLDEFAQMSPRVWTEIIRPALADRKGWAIFIGTPQGRNHFSALYDYAGRDDKWFAAMHKASETGILDAEELQAARREMDPDEYAQEFECSFQAAIKGAFYGPLMNEAEKDGRITAVPHERLSNVITAWDLGIGDSTAIWFAQVVGSEIRLIDYYENSGAGLDHYAKVLQDRGYIYDQHIFPHDVQAKELGTGKSRQETLEALGVRVTVAPRLSVEDGINAVRKLLPRCWFDKDKTAQGLESLRQYRREWDDKRKAFRNNPLHDWTSHAADAFRYLAVGMRESKSEWAKPLEYDTRWVV